MLQRFWNNMRDDFSFFQLFLSYYLPIKVQKREEHAHIIDFLKNKTKPYLEAKWKDKTFSFYSHQ